MKRVAKAAFLIFLALLPSPIKIMILNAMGHSIDRTARIGLCFLWIKRIEMGPRTYLGMGNIFTRLQMLKMAEGSRINRWNRITSDGRAGAILDLGERSSISLRHYLDICAPFRVGHDTIIAGHRSTFFTHSKGIEVIDFARPIEIGNWCYLGSDLRVAPGTRLGSHNFVGMGAVLAGDHAQISYSLLVGNPAKVKRKLAPDAAYFMQGPLTHGHH